MNLNPESVDKYDPYINDLFIDIFRQEDNEELARMFAVGLPINDPAAVVPAVPAPAAVVAAPAGSTLIRGDHDVVVGKDKDGDVMRVSYVAGVTQDYDCEAALIFRVSDGGFLMPIERVPGLIAWLNSRVAKHERGES